MFLIQLFIDATPFYRAAFDAGSWLFQLDAEARETYMESYLITKDML